MARHLRLASAVAFVVAVTMGSAVPALGTDHGLVHLASWGSEDEVGSHVESIAATADGSIVVADRKRDRVVRFAYGHALAGSFAATDPRGIAAIPGGYLVAETGRVRRTDADGTTLATYGADDPYGVALAGDTVLIADASDDRILRYRLDGSELAPWKARLVAPRGLAVGPDGTVYVADAGRWRIETFSADGEDTGGWWVPDPHGVAVGPDGTVYVATDDVHRLKSVQRGGRVHRQPPRLRGSARRRRRLPRHRHGGRRLASAPARLRRSGVGRAAVRCGAAATAPATATARRRTAASARCRAAGARQHGRGRAGLGLGVHRRRRPAPPAHGPLDRPGRDAHRRHRRTSGAHVRDRPAGHRRVR